MAGDVTVRTLRTIAEITPLVPLQIAVWGHDPDAGHIYPARALFAFAESGGLVGGAYDDHGDLIGFSAAWLGREAATRRVYLQSQLVGVLASHRDRGVGLRLKLHQRDHALEQGLALVKWTFDPLRPRNAVLNLHKLGAVARRFVPDFYGEIPGRLNAGRPSDRLWAEWYVGSAHVMRRLRGGEVPRPPAGEPIGRLDRPGGRWVMPEFAFGLAAPTLLLELPGDLDTLAASGAGADAAFLGELQLRLRRVFADYLPRYTITDCARTADRIVYVLQRAVDAELDPAT